MNDQDVQSEKEQLEKDLLDVQKLSTEIESNPYSHQAYVDLINKFKSMGQFMAEELQNARSSMSEKVLLSQGMLFLFLSYTF